MTKLKPYGPRGVIMLALSIVAFGRGIAYLIPGSPTFTPQILTDMAPVFPLYIWGALWIITGLALVAYAWQRNQAVGLLAMIPMSTLWALVYLYAAIMRAAEDGLVHAIGSFITASVYIALAVIVVSLTRLINLPRAEVTAHE